MDRFETPYQPERFRDDPKRFILKRLLVVAFIFGAIVFYRTVLHPLAPGSVSISISGHPQFAAGAPEKLKVTMNTVHGSPIWTSVDWGDGITESNPNRHPTFHGDPCQQFFVPTDGSTAPPVPHVNVGTLPPEHGYVEFLHRYRRPGTYRVTVHADEFFWVCTNQRSPSGSGSILLHVTGPAARGNGPSDPQPALALKLYNHYSILTGFLGAEDRDGYLRSITVTWADGVTRVYVNDRECVNHDNIWPPTALVIHWRQHIKPGSYTVTITALSTDCSGRESQSTTLVASFRLSSKGTRIQMGEVSFLPHEPNGKPDSSLPRFNGYQEVSVP